MLELIDVARTVGGEAHLSPVSMRLEPGTFNVLLGPTFSGKTTLLRLMAGLDQPTSGHLMMDGEDVTGLGARKRDVAMVYQDFINYPGMTVRENIASPLRVRRESADSIAAAVERTAGLLGLEDFLERKPHELSGGQQQRVALARAIVKRARLVLLDEPLANLDYKLREELREQLPKLFRESGSIVVYATSEPSEALLLGGMTATLHEGRVTQFGPSEAVYRQPQDLATARTFSDPPINLAPAEDWSDQTRQADDRARRIGFRAHHLRMGEGAADDLAFEVSVASSEITGSESYVHVTYGAEQWCMLLHGVHTFEAGARLQTHVRRRDVLAFAEDGSTVAFAGAQ